LQHRPEARVQQTPPVVELALLVPVPEPPLLQPVDEREEVPPLRLRQGRVPEPSPEGPVRIGPPELEHPGAEEEVEGGELPPARGLEEHAPSRERVRLREERAGRAGRAPRPGGGR